MRHDFEPSELQEVIERVETKLYSAQQQSLDEIDSLFSDFENEIDDIEAQIRNLKSEADQKHTDFVLDIQDNHQEFEETLADINEVLKNLKVSPGQTIKEVQNDESF